MKYKEAQFMKYITDNQQQANNCLAHLIELWTHEGRNPMYHRMMKQKLKNEWRMLYDAIEALTNGFTIMDTITPIEKLLKDFYTYAHQLGKDSDIYKDFLINYSENELFEVLELAYSAYFNNKTSE